MKILNILWQRACGKLPRHRLCYTYADIIHENKRYCRCRLCGHHYWTDKAPRKEVR